MSDSKLFPISLRQNPAPVTNKGQDYVVRHRAQVENILGDFLRVLPDNYVSEVSGPHYILQYQAFAEALAEVQLTAQEIFEDSDFDFTRSEFLFQILGALVFPQGSTEGIPTLEGDVSYRDFLKQMVLLLLRGAKRDVVQEGIELLTDAEVQVLEKALLAKDNPGSSWGINEQFEFEVNIIASGGTSFPQNPFILLENVRLVLQALKPAHTIFEYRHLFLDTFGDIFSDASLWDLSQHFYDDFRKYCAGAKSITGDSGQTLVDRRLFTDVTRSFSSVPPGAQLLVSGPNAGVYRVEEVLRFPVGTDTTPRLYTTSPTGLTGLATISVDDVTDSLQDWSFIVEGEILTILSGPNAGDYRIDLLLGLYGGPLGFPSTGPVTSVRVSKSLLRLTARMPYVANMQSYAVDVDYLGVREPQTVLAEDASTLFYL